MTNFPGQAAEDLTLSLALRSCGDAGVKVLGAERRRRWNYDEKVRLVEETLQAGETVCGVARRHGMAATRKPGWPMSLPASPPIRLIGWTNCYPGIGRLRRHDQTVLFDHPFD